MASRSCFLPRRALAASLRLLVLAWALPPLSGQTADSRFAVPAIIGDGWDRADLAASGMDATRLRALLGTMMDGRTNIHSVVIERHGHLLAEVYRKGKDRSVYSLFASNRDFGPAGLHDTRSVSKSVVSLLIGIARHQGKIGDLSTPVIDFYPEDADLATPERKAITLADLLTMSSGLAWSEGGEGPDDEHRLYWKWSPYRYVLSRPIAGPPGRKWNYNGGGTAVLADILARATQTPLKDFARKMLFEPLDIREWEWMADLHGRPLAFSGLRMRPRDMAKIGRLVLNHGQWQGQQIVPADWIAASMQPRLETGIADFQYGYQWWLGPVDWHGRNLRWSAAFGNGGQRIFVVPDLDMTVVITAGAYGDPQIGPRVNAYFKDIISTVQE
ncbi:MAG TPA: serine hydrolase [Holophagaceae bacterium]|jgi:CubicO group peptidase (beta-lactamase class C family)|nr:serine hydrolase [Holophagaceae bacterium]